MGEARRRKLVGSGYQPPEKRIVEVPRTVHKSMIIGDGRMKMLSALAALGTVDLNNLLSNRKGRK